MDTAEALIAYAEDCERKAALAESKEVQEILYEAALQWRRLAEDEQRR